MKCAHDVCQCEAQAAFDGYCSTDCAAADQKGTASRAPCRCGHDGCGEGKRQP